MNLYFGTFSNILNFYFSLIKMLLAFSSFRFKENNIIDKDLYSYNSTLVIPAAAGFNGTYRCRVVNEFGSEFSDRAVFKIVGMYLHLSQPGYSL